MAPRVAESVISAGIAAAISGLFHYYNHPGALLMSAQLQRREFGWRLCTSSSAWPIPCDDGEAQHPNRWPRLRRVGLKAVSSKDAPGRDRSEDANRP
jgi:hypothetical protein